jgi:hypothetical protein
MVATMISSVAAQTAPQLRGTGSIPCQEVMETNNINAGARQWLLGWLSAMEAIEALNKNTAYLQAIQPIDNPSITWAAYDYCRSNPGSQFIDAAYSIYRKYGGRYLVRITER